MSDHTELMNKAEELAVEIQMAAYAEFEAGPGDVDHLLTEKAMTHVLAAALLLKGTTEAFKAEMVALEQEPEPSENSLGPNWTSTNIPEAPGNLGTAEGTLSARIVEEGCEK